MDVDDVLAFVETGAVDGSLTVADGARVIGAAINVAKGIGHQGCHLGGVISVVVDGHKSVAVILYEFIGTVNLST